MLSSGIFLRAGRRGQDAEGGFENIPLHFQLEDFVAQGLVLGPEPADVVERLGGFLRRGGLLRRAGGYLRFQVRSSARAEAQFGGNFFQAPAAVVEEVRGGLFERFVVPDCVVPCCVP